MNLYEKMEVRREDNNIVTLPPYIANNLNPRYELRPYQVKAFENFITYYERDNNRPSPTQVLFHMATGSGKTLIMAGLMLYLYKQGYRNFLFFVNLTNIVEKTKDNFLNLTSNKYQFADVISIDGEKIRIHPVKNFQQSEPDAINICFVTTQGLHSLWTPKENHISFDDFEQQKVVLLSDEAHHLNALTKNSKSTKQSSEDIEQRTWEHTVNCILQRNKDNILLEFTATCDLNNQNIRNAYENRIIFDYALTKFYNDKYSKSIETLCSNADETQRILQALIVSQYRLKIFQNNRLSIKPIILFKSKTIKDSSLFIGRFHLIIQNLSEKQLQDLSAYANDGILAQAFRYFKDKGISHNALVSELKDEFSTDHCLSVNDESEADKMQLKLNSLEDSTNPYRVIFEVKKLDEGWDVLNLFDIVRMYESKSKTDTISEAQLIGRGARYCPFQIDEEQPKFQRKYDEDVENDLRICETLYYHCQNDAHYISELKKSLREIGLDLDKMITRKYTLKKIFKKSKFYRTGKVFSNERRETPRNTINELLPKIRDGLYRFEITSNGVSSDSLMNDNNATNSKQNSLRQKSISIREIADINYAIVNKALMKHPFYCFNTLKSYFPNLDSTCQFITDDHYLGGVNITIRCPEEEPTPTTLYKAVLSVVGKIADALLRIEKTYIGTKVFKENNVRDVFKDKTVHYSSVGTSGDGRGISQNESPTNRLDLSKEDWFVYQDNFGTSEEKAFVCLFKEYAERLQAKYSRVFLVRNERAFHIYSFNNGQRFEPDYILFLQNNKTDGFEQFQIFIEPKGEHLLEKDAWKENLLLSLKKEVEIQPTIIQDNNEYRIWGLHFYNQNRRITAFKKDMESLLND